MIGIFSDSYGDVQAFDSAVELLRQKGAKRFIFTGGRYSDLDEWILMRRQKARGGRAYTDTDFLSDVSNWLGAKDQVERPPAFFGEGAFVSREEEDDLVHLKDKFIRTPERECLQYQDPHVDKKAMDMLGDTLCCIVHDKNDLNKEDLQNALVFIHGKASEPKVVQIGPRYFVTPGKLTGAAEQTCATIELVEKSLRFAAFTLDGKEVVPPQMLTFDRRTKLSVK